MKKLVILIIILLVGITASFCLVFFPDLQEKQADALPNEDGETNKDDEEESKDPLHLSFSHKDTFYAETIQVEIICKDSEAEIYYTLDGSTPDKTDKKYNGAITVKSGRNVNATTIKAIAIKGEDSSELHTKSYVTGKNVFDRFDDSTYVFVLSSDPYNLYDYYYGVCVEGHIRDQWLENEYKGGEIPYDAPANWSLRGRESERDMYVEVYDSKGNQLIDQAAGGRVVGGASRAVDQKSWRLIARNEYSEGNGKFKFPFFEGATDAYGQLLTRFDRITLRNNANDREFASIRDEVAMQLAKNAGFPDTQETVPAAVFLNGKYYGFSWLHEAYCNDYLESMYGGNKDNFKIVGGKETKVEGDDERSVNDYNYICELAEKGLTDDSCFDEFCSLVDIDNMILYYAIQIYINNEDWPGNNFKAWRYYPGEDEKITSSFLDGKWRFLLYDAEYGMGLYGNGYREPTLSYVVNGGRHMGGTSPLLKAVLERDDMKIKFTNTICDLMYGEFSFDNANQVINDKIKECNVECMYALDNGYTSSWANRQTFEDSRNQIRDFFKNRPKVIIKDLKKVFGFEDSMFTVSMTGGAGGDSYLNTVEIKESESESRDYYSLCPVLIKAKAYQGYKFSHWEINDARYENSEMSITSDMAVDGKVVIKAVYEKTQVNDEQVYISKLYTAGKSDSITLYNPNSSDIKLSGFYLSDKSDKLDKWEIPSVVIKAESELVIVCKNNKDESALQKLITNFNLKTGETVYLSNPDLEIISKAEVVDMEENQWLIRKPDGCYVIENIS